MFKNIREEFSIVEIAVGSVALTFIGIAAAAVVWTTYQDLKRTFSTHASAQYQISANEGATMPNQGIMRRPFIGIAHD